MRIVLFAALVGMVSTPALAQLPVEVTPPPISFESPPPLVTIAPGVQVVPDLDEEVFFVDGYYWSRRGDVWYRMKGYQGGWLAVQDKDVPPALKRLPKGKYKHYKRRKEHGAGAASEEEARAREQRAQERAREREQRDQEARAREEQARERAAREREQRDQEARAREERARERAREREQRDQEARAREEQARERGRERSERRAQERDRNRADGSRGQGPTSRSAGFPGNNEFSVHIGYQAGIAGTFANPSGFKLFAEYGHRFSDLVWLDVQANNVFGFGPSPGVCYDRFGNPFPCAAGYYYGGSEFELAVGVKLKILTRSPLVVEIPILGALEIIYDRQCRDAGVSPAVRMGGGVKYFVTRSIGLGGGINFAVGPGFHQAGDCSASYTDSYGAFDFQMGAEFIF